MTTSSPAEVTGEALPALTAADGLPWLMSIPAIEFLTQFWNQAHLQVARQDPLYLAPLTSAHEIEFLLDAACGTSDGVEAFRDGERTQACATPAEATDALDLGASLRINSAQRFSVSLALFARALEQQFSAPASVNAYLSPPGCRALGRHYDSHDVFIAQIRGAKRWRIYKGRVQDPVEFLPLLRREQAARRKRVRLTGPEPDADNLGREILDDFVLHAGDSLYLPRGSFHECQAEEGEASWHLTFGIHAYTYLDLLTAALGGAARLLPELRRRLPAGFASHTDAAADASATLRSILPRLLDLIDPQAALTGVAAAFSDAQRSLPRLPTFESRDPVALDTRLRLHPGRPCCLERVPAAGGPRVRILSGGLEITLPADFEPALRQLATGAPFTPRELPGNISDDERVSLGEKLLQDGVLALALGGCDLSV